MALAGAFGRSSSGPRRGEDDVAVGLDIARESRDHFLDVVAQFVERDDVLRKELGRLLLSLVAALRFILDQGLGQPRLLGQRVQRIGELRDALRVAPELLVQPELGRCNRGKVAAVLQSRSTAGRAERWIRPAAPSFANAAPGCGCAGAAHRRMNLASRRRRSRAAQGQFPRVQPHRPRGEHDRCAHDEDEEHAQEQFPRRGSTLWFISLIAAPPLSPAGSRGRRRPPQRPTCYHLTPAADDMPTLSAEVCSGAVRRCRVCPRCERHA